MNGVVVETEHITDFIEEFWLLTSRRVRHIRAPFWRLEIADKRHWAKLPENPANITLSRQNGQLINGWTKSLDAMEVEVISGEEAQGMS